MKKVIPIKHDKIWGYEIWLYSPVAGKETKTEDGNNVVNGPLIKIIKANQPLSVQVHPDDKFALELENQQNGKAESWYVLDAERNASLVVGLSSFDEKFIRESLANKTFKNLLVNTNISIGDFINVPAGLVHGIGAGATVFEVQQPSDTTYRYYDYDRLENGKPRELHVDKAIKVQKNLSWSLDPISEQPLIYKNEVGTQEYRKTPSTIKERSIVVDFDARCAYICEAGEKVNFKNYCIVSF